MGPHARPLPQVRGREQQLAQIGANLRDVTGARRSRVLLVEAASGTGKTRLLLEAAGIAARNGFTVVGGVAAGHDGAPRASPAAAGAHPHPPGTAEDGFHHPTGSLAIEAARARLRTDAEHHRTVVALDDLHLADPPALSALCDLVIALGGRPILWLLAFAPDGDAAPYQPVKTCLGRLRGRLPTEPLRELGPLPGEALAQLVADCAGAAPGPTLLALAESVNTTPRAVIELMRALAEDGDLQVVDGISRVRTGPPGPGPGVGAGPGTGTGTGVGTGVGVGPGRGTGVGLPNPVPKRFSMLMRREFRSLSAPTMKALRLAAVLGSPFAPEDLSAMLGEAPVGLLAAVDEAVGRGLLVCGRHDLAFRSEPIWRVLLDSVPLPMCALLRRQAAGMLLPRPDGIERAALQLVHVAQPGDAEELDVIAEGAHRLLATDPSTAASLATRCMELLTPGRSERVRLARTAVEGLTRAGDPGRAITLAKDTIDEVARLEAPLSAPLATDVAGLRASMSTALLRLGNARMAHRAAGDALAAQAGGPPQQEAVITHLAASYLTGDSTGIQRAQKILSAPGRHVQAVRVGALTVHSLDQWREGRVGDAVETLRKAVALDHGGESTQLLDPRWFLAFALTRTDEYDEAAAVVEYSARPTGPDAGRTAAAVPAVLRAPLHLAQGRLDEAEEAARIGVATDGLYVPIAPQAWLVLATVALRRGALTEAEAHIKDLDESFPQDDASPPWWPARLLLNAQLAEAQVDARAAMDVLMEIAAHAGALRELVLEDPAAAGWCVRSALAADRPGIAQAVVETTEYLRTHNQHVPAVLAAATHARALAEGDADALAQAGRLHRNPWARAAVTEDHAGLLLDRGDHEAAISRLDRAMGAYGALGGERDAARVRARLRLLGVRRRHWTQAKRPVSGWESLTKTERKVAELVACGLTNQQAARRLFISPHTVGFHLRQVYRKMGIRSRAALIRLRTQ
ncbi:LuxR C-terminal-related transcriptional regulator [Streptomyces yaizuensis]|uniref:LuxR family transcriptional regulator n=1 Tax=Streptomyces yaizuensis TaxID=2989713 RepID=A0ABQ5NXH0_9ACTN|nr:LuxR C-terminal-related transcriptional regulator [Streptomyces sp. YSPA8]GLF94853.1 LuxR family transcriptional regulator [Streptomyces sp. YSPA8]